MLKSISSKKLKTEGKVNIMLDNNLSNDCKLSANIDKIVKNQINEESNKQTLTQNVIVNDMINKKIKIKKEFDDDSTQSSEINENSDLVENKKIVSHYNDDNTSLTGESQGSGIRVCKIEKLCAKPQENNTLLTPEDIKCENTICPQLYNDSSTNSAEYNFKEKYYSGDDNTSNKQKRRKLNSGFSEYNQTYDVFKSGINYDSNNMEAIDMLHDLDTVLNFEESKVSMDFFSSTANYSPEMDPLFIAGNHEHSTNMENEVIEGQKSQKKRNNKVDIQERTKRSTTNKNVKDSTNDTRKRKRKSTNEDADINYDVIKDILGELDIEIEPDETGIDNEISGSELERLYDLQVQMLHNVPPQHMIEHTAGSKTLTKEEKSAFLRCGPLKSGAFTPNEDKVIKDNWAAFCKTHDWNPEQVRPFLYMKAGNKFYIRSMEERQKFVQFLANGLPWRTLYSVYHRFRYLYGNYGKSFKRYTSSEDKKILAYMKPKQSKKKKDRRFSELAKMLGRTNHSVWSRYQLLKKAQENENEKSSSEIKWTLQLIGKFIKTFMDITLCEEVEELKNAIIPKVVWQKLEKKLDIDHNILRTFWIHQLHMQLFCPEPIYLNDIKIRLIEYVYGRGIADTREIVWPSAAKHFDGVTSIFLCKVFSYLVKDAATKIGTNSFPDIVEYLYTEKIQDIRNDETDKFLPRLSYDKGVVKILKQM